MSVKRIWRYAGTGNLAHPHEPRLRSAPPGKHKGPQTQASSPHTYVPGSQLSSHYHSAIHGNVLDASPGRRSTATDDGQFISPTRSRSLSATSSQISSHANGAAVTASSLASSAVPGTPVAASRSSRSPKAAFTGRVLGCVPVCGAPSGAGTHSQAVPGMFLQFTWALPSHLTVSFPHATISCIEMLSTYQIPQTRSMHELKTMCR